jgi:hypothetical protein
MAHTSIIKFLPGLAVLLFLYDATTSHAIERIAIPNAFPPHPRLFMNQEEIDRLRTWADTEEWARRRIEGFIRYNLQDAAKEYKPDRRHNASVASKARYIAFAYALSGDERLARKVAEILLAYADVYPTYPVTGAKGRATSSTLHEAPWAINLSTAYDFIYNSGVLSDEDKAKIEGNLFRPCAEVLRICNHRTKGNWRSWAIAGLGVVGFCIGEREYIDEALNGYRDGSGRVVRYGFAQQVAESILADGIFWERSLGYHFYALNALAMLAEAARHSGVDLWRVEITGNDEDAGADMERRWGETGKKSIKMMFDAPFYYVFPDLSGAAIADSHTFHLRPSSLYEMAYRAYGDEKYAWLLNQRRPHRPRYDIDMMWFNPDPPPGRFDLSDDARFGLNGVHKNACTLFPSAGYVILRENATRDATCLLMTYGRYGSGHGHPDKLHISLYSHGKIVAPDPGSLGYDNPEHLTWANQTIAHNTVTVDEVSQYPQGMSNSIWAGERRGKPSVGRLIFFYPGKHLKAARATCDNAYEGVILDRTVALVDSRIFDIYRVRSKDEHQYDWAFHVDGQLSGVSLKPERYPGVLSPGRGYLHITDVQRARMADRNCDITYSISEGYALRLTILPIPDGELILGNGLKTRRERMPMAIVRTRAQNADFVALMTVDSGSTSDLNVERLEGMPEGVIGLKIENPDGGRDYLVTAETPQKIRIAGREIYGQLIFVREDESGEIMEVEAIR